MGRKLEAPRNSEPGKIRSPERLPSLLRPYALPGSDRGQPVGYLRHPPPSLPSVATRPQRLQVMGWVGWDLTPFLVPLSTGGVIPTPLLQ